uniref:Potassium channel domain-containing protein n=1 Tax=Hemiselmis andersenii TaxID=464988 RepID=A0A7S1HM29_HEMAN|mmetsp:Transcript_7472/g.18108  ORF Transcript_7472/g.18108 Transcript_7472/m.18108 type:complete len:313 (+) Transcript_7472:74-1012(+)
MVQVLGVMAHGLKFEDQLGEHGDQLQVETDNERLRKQHQNLLEQELDKSWKRSYKKPWFWCVVAFIVWTFAGIAWYALWHEWGFLLAFYYHLQAGLSIGFGFPTEDDICYKEDIASSTVRYYTEGKFRWPSPAEGGRGGCQAADISKAVTVIFVLVGSSIIASAIGVIAQALTAPAGGWYKTLIAEEKIKHLSQLAAESPGIADDVVIFLKILSLKSWFQALVCITGWVAVGILYGMLSEQQMTFITSFYYSVSSVSTAGLESPKTIQGNPSIPVLIEELNPGHWAFSGIYVLIGVPLYGWALSALASGYAS